MLRFMRKVRVWFKQMEKARSNRLAIEELQKFTDKQLQDLGDRKTVISVLLKKVQV